MINYYTFGFDAAVIGKWDDAESAWEAFCETEMIDPDEAGDEVQQDFMDGYQEAERIHEGD